MTARGVWGVTVSLLLGVVVASYGTQTISGQSEARDAGASTSSRLVATPGTPTGSGVDVPEWLRGWPMVGHDPQRTSRSPETGPIHPHLLWTFKNAYSDPVVGPKGSIYAWGARGLIALDASGHQQWQYPAWEADGGPPALAPDGSVGVLGPLHDRR